MVQCVLALTNHVRAGDKFRVGLYKCRRRQTAVTLWIVTFLIMNNTAVGSYDLKSPLFGYIAIAVSALGFGTNYIPVKKFNMGDGT